MRSTAPYRKTDATIMKKLTFRGRSDRIGKPATNAPMGMTMQDVFLRDV
jgi:DNA topoisomerase IA